MADDVAPEEKDDFTSTVDGAAAFERHRTEEPHYEGMSESDVAYETSR